MFPFFVGASAGAVVVPDPLAEVLPLKGLNIKDCCRRDTCCPQEVMKPPMGSGILRPNKPTACPDVLARGEPSANVYARRGDAPIAVARAVNVYRAAHRHSARGGSLARMRVLRARRRVDRHRAAIWRFGDDRLAAHTGHGQHTTLPLPARAWSTWLCLGAVGAAGSNAGRLGGADCRAEQRAYAQSERQRESQAGNQQPPAPIPAWARRERRSLPHRRHVPIIVQRSTSFTETDWLCRGSLATAREYNGRQIATGCFVQPPPAHSIGGPHGSTVGTLWEFS